MKWSPLLVLLLAAAAFAGESDGALRLSAVRAGMEACAGPLPELVTAPPRVREESTEDAATHLRKRIALEVESGDWLPAYLLLPKEQSGKVPGILALHQTTPGGKREPAGVEGKTDLAYGAELAARGYVVLAPDYPGFGDYAIDAYSMGYASATMKGILNHRRCIDYLCSLAEVDPHRIGCIGHSLGGHNTLFLSAFDDRVKALVTSCGFTRFHRYYEGDLTGWTHKGYMPRIASIFLKDPDLMPFDFPLLLASLAPRAVFINAPLHDANFDVEGVRECVEAARPVYEAAGNESALVVVYPDCEHKFLPEIREQAYAFLDDHLQSK